jgi:hypothetical protein
LGSNPAVYIAVETYGGECVRLAIEREIEEEMAPIGRFEAGGPQN